MLGIDWQLNLLIILQEKFEDTKEVIRFPEIKEGQKTQWSTEKGQTMIYTMQNPKDQACTCS